MYLTLPLPIKKKWRHAIYFIPWNSEKPHLRVCSTRIISATHRYLYDKQIPIELDYDASFKELRRVLGRWTDSHPDYVRLLI